MIVFEDTQPRTARLCRVVWEKVRIDIKKLPDRNVAFREALHCREVGNMCESRSTSTGEVR